MQQNLRVMAKTSGSTRGKSPSTNPNLKGAGNTTPQTKHHYKLEYDDAIEHIMKLTGVEDRREAVAMYNAIDDFSYSDYDEIRAASYRGKAFRTKDLEKADALDRFIELSPKWNGGTTWRGLNLSDDVIDSFDKSMIGKTFDPMGISSWSSDQDASKGFTNLRNQFYLRCEKPQNGTSIRFASSCPSENEVTCSSRCQYKITNVTKETNYAGNKVTIVDLEPIANKPKRK